MQLLSPTLKQQEGSSRLFKTYGFRKEKSPLNDKRRSPESPSFSTFRDQLRWKGSYNKKTAAFQGFHSIHIENSRLTPG
ncbi:hypothetical protein Chls_788 [Chlamydia suis]|uniref:Uncharacterized protein n=1 Tax=Chlamydia suis TaxID=83559 RepID=A0ABX6IRP0_9CHLA|nr:hypothetical protein Chls_788 [Chlamydia suis]